MKKVTAIIKVLAMASLIFLFSTVSVFASAGLKGEEINLVSEDSGYKIYVPNFIDVKTVDFAGEKVTVVVMETPQEDKNSEYTIFEIVTTEKNAVEVQSFPGIYGEGQLGHFSGRFEGGRLTYSVNFPIDKDLKDIVKDQIFIFDFAVYDKNSEPIFSVVNLNFMFTNKAETPAPVKSFTAKPTSSKVLVNGSEVAFEAYNIEGNNYFKLRDLAKVINGTDKQFEVKWDGEKNAINVMTKSAYTPDGKELTLSQNPSDKAAAATQSLIFIDNTEVKLTAYNIGGNNYFKLRDIAKAIDFNVTWDGTLNQIKVDTNSSYTAE